MIHVQVTPHGEYAVTYYLEGLQCTKILVKDLKVALDEIAQKMRMDMGIHKGKVFTSGVSQ